MNYKIKLVFLFFFFSCFLFSQNGKSRKYLVEGNKNYLLKSYDEAAANYLRAIQEGENSYKSNFNLGNAMFKLKKYDDAISQYEISVKLASNKTEEANAYFNIGDSYYKKREYFKAAEFFKRALKLNPKDGRAQYNYSLAKQKLKQQQEKQQQEKKEEQEEQQGQEKNAAKEQPEDSSGTQSKNDKLDIQQGQSGGSGENQSGQGSGNEEGRQGIKNIKLNEKKAFTDGRMQNFDGYLGSAERKEREAQKKIINKSMPSSNKQQGKDW